MAEADDFLALGMAEEVTCDRIHCNSSSEAPNHIRMELGVVQKPDVAGDPGCSQYTIHKGNAPLWQKRNMVVRQIASTHTLAADTLGIEAVVLEGNLVVDRHFLPLFVYDPCS